MTRPLARLPETTELLAFVTAADEGSIRGAARRLHLSPAGLAKRLDHLEAVVGRRLLTRGPLGLSLTEVGRELYGRAVAIVDETHSLSRLDGDGDDTRLAGLRRLLARHTDRATAAILADTERLLAAVFDALPEPVAIVDLDEHVVVEANGALSETLELSPDQLAGMPIEECPGLTCEEPLAVLDIAGRRVALVRQSADDRARIS